MVHSRYTDAAGFRTAWTRAAWEAAHGGAGRPDRTPGGRRDIRSPPAVRVSLVNRQRGSERQLAAVGPVSEASGNSGRGFAVKGFPHHATNFVPLASSHRRWQHLWWPHTGSTALEVCGGWSGVDHGGRGRGEAGQPQEGSQRAMGAAGGPEPGSRRESKPSASPRPRGVRARGGFPHS